MFVWSFFLLSFTTPSFLWVPRFMACSLMKWARGNVPVYWSLWLGCGWCITIIALYGIESTFLPCAITVVWLAHVHDSIDADL